MSTLEDKTSQLITTADNSVYDFEAVYRNDGRITEAKLTRSRLDKGWDKPETVAINLTDNDNEVVVKVEGKKPIKFQYHEICELFIVLNEYMKSGSDLERCDYKRFVEEKIQ
ncbi:MAG: hypothetical protein V3U54_08480 [Thermodesulfobacteriota bacterium]